MARTNRGFTLTELLIVVALIAILSSIAVQNLLASRISANESAAIGTLRSLTSAQAQAVSRAALDLDSDGRGEHLYLAELSGVVNLRGMGNPLDPALVSVSMGNVANSVANKAGYNFLVYLPDAAGAGVAEDPAGGKAAANAVSADLAETFWCCYAWPTSFGSSGRRAFVLNQSGDILQTSNATQQYSGAGPAGLVPTFDAAFAVAGDMTASFSIGGAPGPAIDGGLWLPVN